jgi:gluconolactonase
MKRNATFAVVALALFWSVTAFGQAGGAQPAKEPPAVDTVAPNIPGVVAAGAKVKALGADFRGTEGPITLPDGSLIFTETAAGRLTKIDQNDNISIFLENVTSSGLAFDKKGRLIGVNGAKGQEGISVFYPKGSEAVLADRAKAPGMNRPNDLTVDSKGGVYFTDPDPQVVWYISPEGKITKVAENITRPNGILLSGNEKVLYVNDIRGEYLLAYDVQPDGTLKNRRNFAKYPSTEPLNDGSQFKFTSGADGLAIDTEGRVYVAGLGGVWVYSPKGELLGTIPTSRKPQNLAFAGPDKKTLYIVGRGAAYKVQMLSQGFKGRPK